MPPFYLIDTHTNLLSFARRKEQMPALGLEAHFCALLGLLLAHTERQQSWDRLRHLLELWKRWYPEPDGRVAILSQALKKVPASLKKGYSPDLEAGFVDLLRGLELDEEEAVWYGRYLCLMLSEPAEDLAQLRDRTTVDLLLRAPDMAAATATPFQQWFAGLLRPQVWSGLAKRVARAWQQADAAELQAWLVDGDQDRLLRLLFQKRLLGGLSDALAECCRNQPGWLGLAMLGKLLEAAGTSRQAQLPAGLHDFLGKTTAGLLQLLFAETEDLPAPVSAGKGGPV